MRQIEYQVVQLIRHDLLKEPQVPGIDSHHGDFREVVLVEYLQEGAVSADAYDDVSVSIDAVQNLAS
jgi:hypothetical protein